MCGSGKGGLAIGIPSGPGKGPPKGSIFGMKGSSGPEPREGRTPTKIKKCNVSWSVL